MTSLFSDDNQNELPAFDPDKDYVSEYLGEGGKFYDPDETVAKKKISRAKAEADYTIKLREQELAEIRKDYMSLREEYNAAHSLKEYIDQLTNGQAHTSSEQPDANDDGKPALTMDQIEGILEQRERTKRETDNLQKVQNKLVERFGPNYLQHLKAQREALGMSAEEADRMAKTNPVAFEKLYLSTSATGEQFETPPQSNYRSSEFTPRTPKRDWNYYENLRKTNPSLYWEPKTINQMHADRKALAEKFYGN